MELFILKYEDQDGTSCHFLSTTLGSSLHVQNEVQSFFKPNFTLLCYFRNCSAGVCLLGWAHIAQYYKGTMKHWWTKKTSFCCWFIFCASQSKVFFLKFKLIFLWYIYQCFFFLSHQKEFFLIWTSTVFSFQDKILTILTCLLSCNNIPYSSLTSTHVAVAKYRYCILVANTTPFQILPNSS